MAKNSEKCKHNNNNINICILSIILIILSILLPVLESACSLQEFECNDGSCIPKSWECDYENDCNDGEDEGDQCENCETAGYICRETNKCIPKQWKCDNWTDCLLQDDEKFCKECSENEFKCNDGECISLDKLCDYNNDCYGGEDENLTLSKQWQSQLNPPHNAVPNQCQPCIDRLNNGTIMCGNKCIKGHRCNEIAECFDNSDECNCGVTNPFYGQCLTNTSNNNTNINSNNNNNDKNEPSTTEFKKIFENDDDAPRWKYCPDGIVWLGFITYPDNDIRYDENPKLKSMVQPNITKVYWIEPKLRSFICSNGKPCDDYQVISETKPGAEFSFGKHQVRYVGSRTSPSDDVEDEAVTCVVDILVLGGMKNDQINVCTSSDNHNLINYDFTVDKNFFLILNSDDLDGKDVDIDTARYYLSDKPHLNCYASIHFEELLPTDGNILYSAIGWMVQHVWPIIGLVIGVILLICGLCCGILCLWRKQAEYKAYQEADDFENTDDEETENEDEMAVTSGQPILHQQRPSISQLSQAQLTQLPPPIHAQLSMSHNPSIVFHPNQTITPPQPPPYIHPTNPFFVQRSMSSNINMDNHQNNNIINNNNNANSNINTNNTNNNNTVNNNNNTINISHHKSKSNSIDRRRRSILGMPVEPKMFTPNNNDNINEDSNESDVDDADADKKPLNPDDNRQKSPPNGDDDAEFLDNEWDNDQQQL